MWVVYLTGNAENQRKAKLNHPNLTHFPAKGLTETQADYLLECLDKFGIIAAAQKQDEFEAEVAELEAIDNAMLES